jgi:hypothetical protein
MELFSHSSSYHAFHHFQLKFLTAKQDVTYHHGISLYWQQFGDFGYRFYVLAKIVLPLRLVLDEKNSC